LIEKLSADVAIIGTGMGGGTLAYALRNTGAKVLLLERGGFLPQEPENWYPRAVFERKRYRARETWLDGRGMPFKPGVHYFVGGNSKVYGAALPRMRVRDFEEFAHVDGPSPAWPVSYDDLEPYYRRAEELFGVHGTTGEDPTEPPRSSPYPLPPIPHEPYIEKLAHRLRDQGLHPSTIPMAIECYSGGRCSWVKTCDGFPCRSLAKGEADVSCVRPALKSDNVRLLTGAFARRLLTDEDGGRVVGVEAERDGRAVEVEADRIVVACGAVNSAALLLRSASAAHPHGLANSSGMVGRNYMMHNNTALMAVDPLHQNPSTTQKTLAVNDFYFGDGDWPYPMGNLQLLGKLQAGMLTAEVPFLPRPVLQAVASRSVDWWVMSEDLPDPENRVTLAPNGAIQVSWRPNNLFAHEQLVGRAKRMLRRAGYSLIQTRRLGIETNSHQCGTLRFGRDPRTSVLDPLCRAHDVENLYVVDGSFFPSSGAMNPGLTIAAQALRVAELAFGAPAESPPAVLQR
jgi:choline dehydrogenase-like flavoprotein